MKTVSPSGKTKRELLPGDLYFNRELSWLEFNKRVLEEAADPTTPTLEKVKFLAIFSSNLDEFFMVRVAGLKAMLRGNILNSESPDKMPVSDVIDKVLHRTRELLGEQARIWADIVRPELAKNSIEVVGIKDLTPSQLKETEQYFKEQVFPVLTPLSFAPAHPFPFLANSSLYILSLPKVEPNDTETPRMSFVGVPSVIPRLIRLKTKSDELYRFLPIEDLIGYSLPKLFFGYKDSNCFTFRVTRNLDYNLLENKVTDLLKSLEKELVGQRLQEAVRLEIDRGAPQDSVNELAAKLGIKSHEIFPLDKPIDMRCLFEISSLPIPKLKFKPFNPRIPKSLKGNEDIFALIQKKDLLVHLPFESFYAVTEFLYSAAYDPNVIAIKQTLYRTAGDSPIIEALISAAEHGKQVTAVVELKARFDEKNNIVWARQLEQAGVHVVFGFVGLKTHAKLTLVVRRERDRLQSYVHTSSGNYNSSTAKFYTDTGLFTSKPKFTEDVANVFNLITGFNAIGGEKSLKHRKLLPTLNKLAVAPFNLREHFINAIEGEIECVRKHGTGLIMAKCNGLVDQKIIDKLYEASQAGVEIRLLIRGLCCLRPGIFGISENIEVRSIVDRFLEHSRVFYFQAAGKKLVYLSSADWMPRNLDRRIEVVFPVEDEKLKARIIREQLEIYWKDNTKARVLQHDGTYKRIVRNQKPEFKAQQELIDLAREDGVKSIPYDAAIRYNPRKKKGRPVARPKRR